MARNLLGHACLALGANLVAAGPSFAADMDFWLVSSGGDQAIAVDLANVRKPSADLRRVWSLMVMSEPPILDGRRMGHSMTLVEFDCTQARSRPLSVAMYGEKGEVLGNEAFTGAWEYVVPESAGDGTMRLVCPASPDTQRARKINAQDTQGAVRVLKRVLTIFREREAAQ